MLSNLIHFLKQKFFEEDTSTRVRNQTVIERFIANADNPFLISFPRTGSHWLRMMMELYFERPTLVRVFYYPDRHDYLLYHTHDLSLYIEHQNVIYLHRHPVDTIYSQLQYHQDDINDLGRIKYWSDLYGRHLDKWLYREAFTKKKTVIRYEELKDNLAREFEKLCNHYNQPFIPERLEQVAEQVTKERVKQKTIHDPQVIQLQKDYAEQREIFRTQHAELIMNTVYTQREYLRQYFSDIR